MGNAYRRQNLDRSLAKDERHKKLSGVCAGIARCYNVPRIAVRAGAIVSLLFFPIPTGVAYLLATLLMSSDDRYRL